MNSNELKKYSKKIVRIDYENKIRGTFNFWGIFIFTSNGFYIYNGYNFRGYSDFHCQLTNNVLYDCIPYSNIVLVQDRINGITVEEYFKSALTINNIYDLLNRDLSCRSFQFEPFEIKEDREGMIYNPYSDRWSYI